MKHFFLQRMGQSHPCQGIFPSSHGKRGPPVQTGGNIKTLVIFMFLNSWIHVLLYLEMIQQILCDCKRCTNHHLRHILWGKIQVHSLIQHWKNIKINQRCIKCVWGSVGTENTLDRPAHSGSSHGRSWWDSSFLCICSPPVNNNTVQ